MMHAPNRCIPMSSVDGDRHMRFVLLLRVHTVSVRCLVSLVALIQPLSFSQGGPEMNALRACEVWKMDLLGGDINYIICSTTLIVT